jgi:hypothetical protein
MDENQIEEIAAKLGEQTNFLLNIEKLSEEGINHWNTNYAIVIYFNDAFYWASSYCFSFVCKNCTSIKELSEKFLDWYEKSGKEVNEKFNAVPYPKYTNGQLNDSEVALYFHENRLLASDMEDSLNSYCGFIEKNFDKKEEMEEWNNSDKKTY